MWFPHKMFLNFYFENWRVKICNLYIRLYGPPPPPPSKKKKKSRKEGIKHFQPHYYFRTSENKKIWFVKRPSKAILEWEKLLHQTHELYSLPLSVNSENLRYCFSIFQWNIYIFNYENSGWSHTFRKKNLNFVNWILQEIL